MKEVKRPEKNIMLISEYAIGFNQCHSKWEEYHNWVMEPILEIKRKMKLIEEPLNNDVWNAIQESVRRSQR